MYLIDQFSGRGALAFAAQDDEAIVVLVQDGVFLDVSGLKIAGRPVYAVQRDIDRRGLQKRLPAGVKPIGFDELVDLIVANKVVNFA